MAGMAAERRNASTAVRALMTPRPPVLFKPLESVRERRIVRGLVRELADQQRERLGVARDPKRAGIQRVEAHLLDQRRSHLLRTRIIAAVEKTRPFALAA
jgi:hypothetical protein